MADSLVAHGASVVRSGSMVFMDQVPEFVTNLVYGDLTRESGLMQIYPWNQKKKKKTEGVERGEGELLWREDKAIGL